MAAAGPFPWRRYLIILLAIIVIAGSPLISVLISTLIADSNGCVVHEGFVNPCVVLGVDIGGGLYGGFVLGWLMLVTFPVGAIALLAWIVALPIHLVDHHRRQRSV
jgi:hypothetical protein